MGQINRVIFYLVNGMKVSALMRITEFALMDMLEGSAMITFTDECLLPTVLAPHAVVYAQIEELE